MRLQITLRRDNVIAPNVPYEVMATCQHWDTTAVAVSWAKGTSDSDGKASVNPDALFGVCTYELKIDGEVVADTKITRGMALGAKHDWTATDQIPSGTGCESIKAFKVPTVLHIPKEIGGNAYSYIEVEEAASYKAGEPIYFVNTAAYVDGACKFGQQPLYGNTLRKDLDANLAKSHYRRFLIGSTWQEEYTVNGNNATAAITMYSDAAIKAVRVSYHIPPAP